MKPASSRTRQVILGLLLGGPKSGYTIKKVVEQSIAHFWSESFGQIYPILRDLERDGLIERVRIAGAGGRPAKLYALTGDGRAELEDWLAAPPRARPPRNELLLKLFLAPGVAPQRAKQLIADFRTDTEAQSHRYAAVEEWLRQAHGQDPAYPYWLATLRYGIREAEAHLAWCEEASRLIGDPPPAD